MYVPQLVINCLCSSHYTDHLVSGILREICCSTCSQSEGERNREKERKREKKEIRSE